MSGKRRDSSAGALITRYLPIGVAVAALAYLWIDRSAQEEKYGEQKSAYDFAISRLAHCQLAVQTVDGCLN
jgi:hypothetical protein